MGRGDDNHIEDGAVGTGHHHTAIELPIADVANGS
jgi:hypothetical protein